ncbi:MAG: 2-oxoacid:acceptor oxidoreductase family protein [Deferrisomatales bacterium]
MRLDVAAAGVGGQGLVTLVSVLVQAAVSEGYDAHSLVQSGLAQLGSPVLAHVRIGTPAAGPSPKIRRGGADLAVGLERLEALKLAPFLRPGATALLSAEAVRPYEARFRRGVYPSPQDVEAAFAGARVVWVPAAELARRHGPPGLVSAVMLGALSGLNPAVERDLLVRGLRNARPDTAETQAEAFFEGYQFVTGREA